MFLALLALASLGLLLFGLVEVWHGRWKVMGAGVGLSIVFAMICFTADIWFPWFNMNRGDGFVLIGLAMIGSFGLVAPICALLLAIPIHFFRKPALRAELSTKDVQ